MYLWKKILTFSFHVGRAKIATFKKYLCWHLFQILILLFIYFFASSTFYHFLLHLICCLGPHHTSNGFVNFLMINVISCLLLSSFILLWSLGKNHNYDSTCCLCYHSFNVIKHAGPKDIPNKVYLIFFNNYS